MNGPQEVNRPQPRATVGVKVEAHQGSIEGLPDVSEVAIPLGSTTWPCVTHSPTPVVARPESRMPGWTAAPPCHLHSWVPDSQCVGLQIHVRPLELDQLAAGKPVSDRLWRWRCVCPRVQVAGGPTPPHGTGEVSFDQPVRCAALRLSIPPSLYVSDTFTNFCIERNSRGGSI